MRRSPFSGWPRICGLAGLLSLVAPAFAESLPASSAPPWRSGLALCLQQAVDANPRIASAQWRARAAGLDADAARLAFRAPVFQASAGASADPAAAPFTSHAFQVAENAASAQAGVEAPVARGVYAGAGVRAFSSLAEDDDDSGALAGARLRVPLWKDRGFAANRLETERLSAESRAQFWTFRATLLDELQAVADGYALLLLRLADAGEVAEALARAETLATEADERARMQDVASYQVFPARYETAVRREELSSARNLVVQALRSLEEAVGAAGAPSLDVASSSTNAASALVAWAASASSLSPADAALDAASVTNCPEVLASEASADARVHVVREAGEGEKPSLDLVLGAGWSTEEDSDTLAKAGYGAALVLRTPIFRDGSRAKIRAAEARARASGEDFASVRLAATVRHAKAVAAFTNACARLALAEASVRQASLSLDAENDRFSIGDGTSRNVLDAQKDLSTAKRRRLAVAKEVVSGFLELRRAAGFFPVDPISPPSHDAPGEGREETP